MILQGGEISVDLLSKYKDNIVFLPFKSELKLLYLRYEDKYIRLLYNTADEAVYMSYSKAFVYRTIDTPKNIIGSITIILDRHLFGERYDKKSYIEGEILAKEHPMYIENVTNTFFETNEYIIHLYHYPNEYINIIKKTNEEFLAIVGDEIDASTQLIYGIKKIISYFNSCRNIYSLHCSAVKKDGKAFVFLAGSYSGKTTLFLNLIHNGYEPINDDIAFWEYHDNNIYIKGIPILFSKRKDKNGLIMSDGYLRAERDENQKDIYSNNVFCESIVDTVFIPEYGHVSSAIADFKSINIKKLLRACSIHSDLVADERFVQSINGLLTCSFRKLEMSNDYNDIIRCIMEAT